MGILDDAIRQHLELKRSLGADDAELKQLEDEAFGPPARPGDPDFPDSEAPDQEGVVSVATDDAEPAAEEDAPEPDDASAGLFDQAAGEPATAEAEPAEAPPAIAEEAPSAPAEDAPASAPAEAVTGDAEPDDEGELDLGELDLEIEEAELPPLDPNPPIESLETVEHKLEPTAGDGEEDGDVLADTPEFLRDAPEDDDLWFEQGEPKDFDFDE